MSRLLAITTDTCRHLNIKFIFFSTRITLLPFHVEIFLVPNKNSWNPEKTIQKLVLPTKQELLFFF